jgi:hypothetical protein
MNTDREPKTMSGIILGKSLSDAVDEVQDIVDATGGHAHIVNGITGEEVAKVYPTNEVDSARSTYGYSGKIAAKLANIDWGHTPKARA